MTALRRSVLTALAGAMAAALLFSLATAYDAGASHEPADKAAAAASGVQVISPTVGGVLLLSETMRVSSPSDLILQLTAECSITTDVTTVGSDTQGAEGMVRLWIEIDGTPVPVSNDDAGDGRVVFCNRIHQRQTSLGGDDQNDTVRTFHLTRHANGFNWFAFDVGRDAVYDKNNDNILTIEVFGELITSTPTARSSALAAVGNRTLVIEPTKASIHEQANIGPGSGN